MKKLLIGIAPDLRFSGRGPAVAGTYVSYLEALESAGAVPVILSPHLNLLSAYVASLDGLLLTGGDDIHPKFFGQKKKQVPMKLSPDLRTHFELNAVFRFARFRKPILGICLGCQTINTAFGGTVVQDLPSAGKRERDHQKNTHWVQVKRNTRLYSILETAKVRVNSRHHQAPEKLGRNLIVSAVAPDGVIEAVENTKHPFLLGVQWHPEETFGQTASKKIFRAFLRACEKRKRERSAPPPQQP